MAAQEFDPGDLGAQSLQITTKTNCTATVENEKVNIDNLDGSLRHTENEIVKHLVVYINEKKQGWSNSVYIYIYIYIYIFITVTLQFK